MTTWHGGRLTPAQSRWVEERLGGVRRIEDMSWNLMGSVVLHVRAGAQDLVVKAGDETNHHIDRELSAHPRWVAPLVETGHAARLVDALPDERVMILEHLEGRLVQESPEEFAPETYAQAGGLLRRLHDQTSRDDEEYEPQANDRTLRWFDEPHRVDPSTVDRVRRILSSDAAPSVTVVPTHGDWQPRNWLVDAGTTRVIDFGRFGFRPAGTDFVRLAAQQWRDRPELEAAFLDGYGGDPRDPERWRIDQLREAVGTAVWAFRVGDEAFEAQGHRMLAEALVAF
ncbi:hypothetical protein GCM10025768_11840 [Microbacterium pseudoresistens]|uniref:Aminoglycoside phosphotransferase domain-containing protein n=1 Tax=Microbacterium pseudoresistens TaxID=640634 RepID=A0A7Y9JMQ8_9MICO|nr:phosphotransferase [Microbacterium pseudoresistens]NYD55087.1 hypothetical protein [Microbacterium pseudoresistens]